MQQNLQLELVISTQWACDIISEFVYQFQGFCQYRTTIAHKSEEEVYVLANNPDLWSLGMVTRILTDLIRTANTYTNTNKSTNGSGHNIHQLLGYFAVIELARLDCLIGDYHASLVVSGPLLVNTITTDVINEKTQSLCGCAINLYAAIPVCHINIYYHAAVSFIMQRRYADGLKVLNDIIIHISQRLLKQGNVIGSKPGLQQQLQRMLDRLLALALICIVLLPCVYSNGIVYQEVVKDQVKELIESHGQLGEKYRLLSSGSVVDAGSLLEYMFENNSPKFISAALPNYNISNTTALEDEDDEAAAVETNYLCRDAIKTQVFVFSRSISALLPVLKLRSYLRLYTTIDLDKLTRYDGSSGSDDMLSKLMSYKVLSLEVTNDNKV